MILKENVNKIIHGEAFKVLKTFQDESIDLVMTHPNPMRYLSGDWPKNTIGIQDNVDDYIKILCDLFHECHRVLKRSGTLCVVLGDQYNLSRDCLLLIPDRFKIKMVDDFGWYLPSNATWWRTEKFTRQTNTNRFKRDTEQFLFFTKTKDNYFDDRTNMLFKKSVFAFPMLDIRDGSFASGFPEGLIEVAIKTSCPLDGIVMDIMAGTGTTGLVAKKLKRQFIMIDQSEFMCKKMKERLKL